MTEGIVNINVRFPREVHDRLKTYAEATGMSLNTAILAAVAHLSLTEGMSYEQAEEAAIALERAGYRGCQPDRATGRAALLPYGLYGVSGRTPGGSWGVWISQAEVDASIARQQP